MNVQKLTFTRCRVKEEEKKNLVQAFCNKLPFSLLFNFIIPSFSRRYYFNVWFFSKCICSKIKWREEFVLEGILKLNFWIYRLLISLEKKREGKLCQILTSSNSWWDLNNVCSKKSNYDFFSFLRRRDPAVRYFFTSTKFHITRWANFRAGIRSNTHGDVISEECSVLGSIKMTPRVLIKIVLILFEYTSEGNWRKLYLTF